MSKLRVLVTGSRDIDPAGAVIVISALMEALATAYPHSFVLVHGGARGVDSVADSWTSTHGIEVERHPANWSRLGKAAGMERNRQMVALGANVCLAFPRPGSRGTWDCIRRAADAGIPVRIYPLPKVGGS